ncbi:hypothetical protein LQZ19_10145 [Treponema primitia]|uniref:hypothetical protein n=1 Tax=Treponema primitia TaxID=88058 RepID=UPI00398037C0
MDTIFTLTVTFLFGPACGILSAILATAINVMATGKPAAYMLYALCSISAVHLTDYFKRHFIEDSSYSSEPFINSITSLLLLGVIMCAIVSILGGLIAMFIHSVALQKLSSPEDDFKLGLLLNNVPLALSEIMGRLPINIVERIFSVFSAYGFASLGKRLFHRYNGGKIQVL